MRKALSELLHVYQYRDRSRICCHDVSVTQAHAIDILINQGKVSLNQVAGELFLNKSTASRAVEVLVQKGYVKRHTDPDDARAIKIDVTKRGRNLHKQLELESLNEMKTMINDFDPDVRQATTRLVARLAKAAKNRFGGNCCE